MKPRVQNQPSKPCKAENPCRTVCSGAENTAHGKCAASVKDIKLFIKRSGCLVRQGWVIGMLFYNS